MSVRQLDVKTSRNLYSTQVIPNFEAAVYAVVLNSVQQAATDICVTILPAALRFTVIDNGRGFSQSDWPNALQPGCTSMKHGRGQSLAALAAVSTVELHSRRGHFFASKLVRAGKLLTSFSGQLPEDVEQIHKALREHNGTVVDVWELFHPLPVRLRHETARDTSHVIDETREKLVALSLANTRIRIILQGGNELQYYSHSGQSSLSVDVIQSAFGNTADLEWKAVHERSGALSLNGFIARRGCSSSGINLVSLDGVPLQSRCWIHRAARKAWKAYVSGDAYENGGTHRYPAFVLNCISVGGPSERALLVESVTRQIAPSDRIENGVYGVIQAALIGDMTVKRSFVTKKDSRAILGPIVKKRRLLGVEERFSEAIIHHRPERLPSSTLSSAQLRLPLARPLSEASGTVIRSRSQQREKTRRLSVGRPISAEGMESVYRKHLPGWSNPCFRGGVHVCRTAISKANVGSVRSHALFDKQSVCIKKEAIPNLRIVGQVDRKFIMVVDDNLVMYAVDQHAASERYLYEQLLKKAKSRKAVSRDVNPSRRVELSYKQFGMVRDYHNLICSWGWRLRVHTGTTVEIVGAPFVEKLGVMLDSSDDLRAYLESLGEGAPQRRIPRPIMNAVASAACHAAVRFGDQLSFSQCWSLVNSLSECESPFTCAHGRPSIVPLAVLNHM